MASTIAPVDAFALCKRYIGNMPLETVQVRILDDVNKLFWMAAPWRWTVGNLTSIAITASTQDYTLAPPSDFLYILDSYITNGTTTNHLKVVPSLPAATLVKGNVDFVSYQGSNTFRVFPNPGAASTPASSLVSFYKKQAPIITASNQNTAGTLVFDDEYFPIYESGVLWMAYLYSDDSRAGAAQIDGKGNMQYSGQRAVFEAGIANMLRREPMPFFQYNNSPDSPTVVRNG